MPKFISYFVLSLVLTAVVGCHEQGENTVPTSYFWKLVPGVNTSRINSIQSTPTNLLIWNRQGFLRIDQANSITGRADLNDPVTLDYPACASEHYAVVFSNFLENGKESVLAVYDLNFPGQPPLRVPLSQLLKPIAGYSLSEMTYHYTGSENYKSGTIDQDGNLFLVFTGFSVAQYCNCLLHYYKFKIKTDAQNNISLQYVNDYVDELKVGPSVTTKLINTGNQLFRIKVIYNTSTTTQLFRVEPQGVDQLVLTAPYEVTNLFQLDKTVYLVTSTSELWSSADSGVSWQKSKTLTSSEKVFFTNCSTSNGAAPLLSYNSRSPLAKTDLNAKIDTLPTPSYAVKALARVQQRYYLQVDTSLYYSDNPFRIY